MLGVKTIIHAHITVSFFRRKKKKRNIASTGESDKKNQGDKDLRFGREGHNARNTDRQAQQPTPAFRWRLRTYFFH